MVSLQIKGAEQFGDLARSLRAAGDKDLKRELYRGLNRAAKPLKAEAKKSAAATLPKSGGLAARVAKSKFSTRTRTGRDPGVSIVVTGTALSTDRGYVSHPVFGTGAWVRQSVKGGWFSNTMRRSAPVARREVIKAMDDVADKIRKA